MKKQLRVLIAFWVISMAGLWAASSASAADQGWYVGGSLGIAQDNDSCDGPRGGGFVGSCDDTDIGFKFFGGYEFNQNFGAEAAYVRLGNVTASGIISGTPVNASGRADGFSFAGVGKLPLANQFSVFGKLGIYAWDVRASATAPGVTAFDKDSGTDIMVGFGGKYDVNKNLGMRLEWEHFRNVIGSDQNLISVGAVWKF